MTRVLQTKTSYSRVLVFQSAPLIEDARGKYQPTAMRYSWYTADPTPRSVEVIVRKLKKDGTVGQTTSMKSYLLGTPVGGGWEQAPQWVQDLVTTA